MTQNIHEVTALAAKRKKIFFISLGCLILLVVSLFPFPCEVDDALKKEMVEHALGAVVENDMVFTNFVYPWLIESSDINDDKTIYFINEIGVSDSIFTEREILPMQKDQYIDYEANNALIMFMPSGFDGEVTGNIFVGYQYGNLAGHGYEIKAYKSLIFTYFVYFHNWVS